MKRFRSFPSGFWIELPLLYRPGDERDELRLYMNRGTFRPQTGMYWFVFERDGEPWLAALNEEELLALHSGEQIDVQNAGDQRNEEAYQDAVNRGSPKLATKTTTSYSRSAEVASDALQSSGYHCEMMPKHETFISQSSGKPYLEAHHFFPMMEQRHFPDVSLDVVDNICVLNPYAHKMVHHARYNDIEGYLGGI